MSGRNGFDQTAKLLLWVGLAVAVINIFVRSSVVALIYYLFLIYCIFRVMSRNIYKRSAENQKVMAFANKLKGKFKLAKNKFRDRKTHVYRVCPHCKANLRLPKRKGTNTVKCPACGTRFEVSSR